MKTSYLCAFALFAAYLLPTAVNAQAPSGVARVDSDTYFDTENASWGYHNHQDNIAPYPDESGSSWFDQGHISLSNGSSDHAGLLGKMYVRGSYLYNGVDDEGVVSFDALEGADVEFNAPIPWISSDELAVDFAAEFEHRQTTARGPGRAADLDLNYATVGVRLFAMPTSRIRPYVLLGASFSEFRVEATGSPDVEEDDQEFVVSVGLEADLASNASIRGDFEIDRDEIDESTFEGTIVLWLGENIFFRGGGVIPLTDGFDPGVTIGGGVAFRNRINVASRTTDLTSRKSIQIRSGSRRRGSF